MKTKYFWQSFEAGPTKGYYIKTTRGESPLGYANELLELYWTLWNSLKYI